MVKWNVNEEKGGGVRRQESGPGQGRQRKAPEKKLDVAEMRKVLCVCGVTKLARIGNERIRGDNGIGRNLRRKFREGHFRWYEYLMRR